MSRKEIKRCAYWSEHHNKLLRYAAWATNRMLLANGKPTMDPWELMNEGWRRNVRFCKDEKHLKIAIHNIITAMYRYAIHMSTPFHHPDTNYKPRTIDLGDSDRIDNIDLLSKVVFVSTDIDFEDAARYFGLGKTLVEIGEMDGVTRERVRQRAEKFLEKARRYLRLIGEM